MEYEKLAVVIHRVLQNKSKRGISRCYFAEHGYEI